MELQNKLSRRQNEGYMDWVERLIGYVENNKSNSMDCDWQDIYFEITNKTVSQTEARKRCYGIRDLLPTLRVESVSIIPHQHEVSHEDPYGDLSEEELEKLSASDEFRAVSFEDFGSYYEITSKKRKIKVSKEKVRGIKKAYCGESKLTINQITRKYDIPRRDFFLVKNAFNITHDDVPYLDEDLSENEIENLVIDTLESRKEQYFLKLEQKELEDLKKENKLYRSKDYLFEKALEKINAVGFDCATYKVREYDTNGSVAILNLADWHIGMKTSNYWNVYNLEVAKERMDDLVDYVINWGVFHKIQKLNVNDLGDSISGIIHESLVAENELDVVDQVAEWVEILGNALIKLSSVFKEVSFASVSGNHSRIFPNKSANGDKDYFERFVPWALRLKLSGIKNLTFVANKIDDSIITTEVYGQKIFGVHGHLDKFNKVASDLALMIEKPREIHMGHLHVEKLDTTHGIKVYISESACGVDNYAKNNRYSGQAGQTLHVYNLDGSKAVYNFPLN